VAFLLIAGTIAALRSGDDNRAFIYRLLDQNKYRDSQLFLLMTLGPMIALLPFADDARGPIARALETFGRVPMFYYLLHILLIHLLALIGAFIDGYRINDMILSTRVNDDPHLKGYGFILIIVYLIWVVLIFLLYPFCKAFSQYKATKQSQLPWLSYL